MRRFLSIATILALLCSVMSPLMAACTEADKAASCHAEPAPHCDRAMHQHHHHDAAPPSESVSAIVGDTSCPMDCCAPSHRQSAAASDASSILPPLAVS